MKSTVTTRSELHTNTKHDVQFTKNTPHYGWKKRILIFGCICVAILLSALFIFGFSGSKNKILVRTYSPTPVAFYDNVSTAFLSSDTVPELNNNRELHNTEPLTIFFQQTDDSYTDVFKPGISTSDLTKKIKITPFVKGTWQKYYDSISFTPDQEWPANTKFTFKMNPGLFNIDTMPNTHTISFKTDDITATLESFNLYPYNKSDKTMVGVAVISFNYPINTKNFADKILLKLDDKKINFSAKFDRFNRTAFIQSEPVSITNEPQIMRLKMNHIPALNGDASTKKLTAHTTLESADNFFKLQKISSSLADDSEGNIQQLILLDTTATVLPDTKWEKYIELYLLPEHTPDDEDAETNHHWSLDEVTPENIKKSTPIKFKPVKFASPRGIYQYAFSYDVLEPAPRYMYMTIKPGLKSSNGFELQNQLSKIIPVQYPAQTVQITGNGALLSMGGDKKLGIVARGNVSQAYINIYKVKSSEINHLVSQTYDLFSNNIDFKSYSFGAYDMSVVFQKTIPFTKQTQTHTNYASLDLGEYLDRTGTDKTGIFIIQTGATEAETEYNDQRLIMLTNLGIINKRNQDGSLSLFIANTTNGTPAPDVEVSVLGRNGNSLWAGRTDENGFTAIPNFAPTEYKNARKPTAIVAKQGNDTAFIPFDANNMLSTEYSKFDIDGEYTNNKLPLSAYVFSDRGIYRPGETVTISGIVKNKNFKSLAGIPVRIEILNSRDREVLANTISLESDGMFDVQYAIPENAPTGTYYVRIDTLNSKNKIQNTAGSTTFQVAEFVPDTMKITASIDDASDKGWLTSQNIFANISLQNLFGTPATDKRISITATLYPIPFTFSDYKDYIFNPNFISNSGMSNNATIRNQTYTTTVPDIRTDNNGNIKTEIKFNNDIPLGTYIMSLTAQGFEGESGKSVQTAITNRISDAPYLIGFHTQSDLNYVNKNSSHSINLIAVNKNGQQTSATDLILRLVKRENLTSLIKDTHNYYKYQTVTQDKIISNTPMDIPESGHDIKLDTSDGGTYFLQILNSSDQVLTNIEYFVATSDNTSLRTDVQTEMKIKLDKKFYNAGDTINISITAPYTGAGLITIERDKVYAYKWFQAKTTSSVQSINVPKDFEGTGYINVSFVRDINSRDIFTCPYAYAVAPFSADTSAHKIDISLTAPKKIDSNKLKIEYKTNKDARIMIFAVNAGILQVAKFQLPDPLSFFFKKSALQVDTYQTLSLILPEYRILREFAKTGGSDFELSADRINQAISNPFARKLAESVAFHSGIITTHANQSDSITFDIPEDFNGSLKIFAVATNETSMGSTNTETQVQAPIIITTTAPTFIAPFDTMNISATISNLTTNTDSDSKVTLFATAKNLTFSGKTNETLTLPQGTEKTSLFSLHGKGTLGNAELTINANLFNAQGTPITTRQSISNISIRPVTPFTTILNTSEIKSSSETVRNFQTDMYPEHTKTQIFISQNANPVLRPIFEYLTHYSFTCSEQVVSRAIPYVLMPNSVFLGTNHEDSAKKINTAINTLKNRQNDDGSFELWTDTHADFNNKDTSQTAYLTAYIIQFLTIAKKQGFNVPKDMLSRGIDYLRTYAGTTIHNTSDAYAVAYAIYILTANGYISTNYINLFEEYANNNIKNWQETLMGAYLATAYKLLKQTDKAENLISKYKMSKTDKFTYDSMFRNNISNDAMYMYLLATHFKSTPSGISSQIQNYINSGNYSSYTSAIIFMGLTGIKTDNTALIKQISLTADDEKLSGQIISDTYIATIPSNTKKLTINCHNCSRTNKLLYTISQHGYPTRTTPTTQGLELVREYYNANGDRITSGAIGDTVTVKIYARARTSSNYIPNVVITDLLPGGFIVNSDSITGSQEFSEIREDRIIIYTSLNNFTQEFTYSAQLGTGGTFAIPPIYAQSMYNPQINATGTTGTFSVSSNVEKSE